MYFPPDAIVHFLSDFCIIKFKHRGYKADSPPHNYISIPVNDDTILLLCIFTSQIENLAVYYSRVNEKALDSLVYLEPSEELQFLTENTFINCNNPELILKKDISKIIDGRYGLEITLTGEKIPQKVKDNVIKALTNSPIVKPFIKKLIAHES